MKETNPQGDAIIIPGNYTKEDYHRLNRLMVKRTRITTITDDFALIKQAANQGRLISLKLVWSSRFWAWMYKYTWWY